MWSLVGACGRNVSRIHFAQAQIVVYDLLLLFSVKLQCLVLVHSR